MGIFSCICNTPVWRTPASVRKCDCVPIRLSLPSVLPVWVFPCVLVVHPSCRIAEGVVVVWVDAMRLGMLETRVHASLQIGVLLLLAPPCRLLRLRLAGREHVLTEGRQWRHAIGDAIILCPEILVEWAPLGLLIRDGLDLFLSESDRLSTVGSCPTGRNFMSI